MKSKSLCRSCAFAFDEKKGIVVEHCCFILGGLRPFRCTECRHHHPAGKAFRNKPLELHKA